MTRVLRTLSPVQALFYGTITVAVLDILDAFVFFGIRDVPPVRILQSIASGLLGGAAFSGGFQTAILGGFLHLFISFCIVGVYLAASRWLPILARRPLLCGPTYGLIVYAIMSQVVVPLSAVASGAPSTPVILNGLLIHSFGVGLPSALFARTANTSVRSGLGGHIGRNHQ